MRGIEVTRSVSKPYRFVPPFFGEDYALLLYVAALDVSTDEQPEISGQIIASGCRYAVCYGDRCSSWDDSIDLAYVAAGYDEQRFVMTTWHEETDITDVTEYFWWNTAFDDFNAQRMGVFVLGSNLAVEKELESRIQRLNETEG